MGHACPSPREDSESKMAVLLQVVFPEPVCTGRLRRGPTQLAVRGRASSCALSRESIE